MIQSFKDIIAWQKAHIFVLSVYECTSSYPQIEKFGLSSQFQRAAVSIASNIAEGYRKKGILDKLRYLNISQSSLEECRYYIILSKDLNYINEKQYNQLNERLEEASRLLNAYYRGIKNYT